MKSRMFRLTICFSSSRHERIVLIISVLLFGKFTSSLFSFIPFSMYFKLSRITAVWDAGMSWLAATNEGF